VQNVEKEISSHSKNKFNNQWWTKM